MILLEYFSKNSNFYSMFLLLISLFIDIISKFKNTSYFFYYINYYKIHLIK